MHKLHYGGCQFSSLCTVHSICKPKKIKSYRGNRKQPQQRLTSDGTSRRCLPSGDAKNPPPHPPLLRGITVNHLERTVTVPGIPRPGITFSIAVLKQ